MMTYDDYESLSRPTDLLPIDAKHAQNPPVGLWIKGFVSGIICWIGVKKRVDAPRTHCGETMRRPLTYFPQILQLISCDARR